MKPSPCAPAPDQRDISQGGPRAAPTRHMRNGTLAAGIPTTRALGEVLGVLGTLTRGPTAQ